MGAAAVFADSVGLQRLAVATAMHDLVSRPGRPAVGVVARILGVVSVAAAACRPAGLRRFPDALAFSDSSWSFIRVAMDFPAVQSTKTEITDQISVALGKVPINVYKARDLMVVFESEKDILDLEPDFVEMAKINCLGVIATAPGKKVDFVSRFFAPRAGINEDPVTGSAHCMLIPFWAERLTKNKLEALQLSKRVGSLSCEFKGERVEIAGKAVTYLIGEINI